MFSEKILSEKGLHNLKPKQLIYYTVNFKCQITILSTKKKQYI